MEEKVHPDVTVKIIGHQWYWSYEISDFADPDKNNILAFDAYFLNVKKNQQSYIYDNFFRKYGKGKEILGFSATRTLFLPIGVTIRLLISSQDVIHSWALPAFGIKTDAIPGHYNETIFSLNRRGHYYGQCSELCGVGHALMPIDVETLNTLEEY